MAGGVLTWRLKPRVAVSGVFVTYAVKIVITCVMSGTAPNGVTTVTSIGIMKNNSQP